MKGFFQRLSTVRHQPGFQGHEIFAPRECTLFTIAA